MFLVPVNNKEIQQMERNIMLGIILCDDDPFILKIIQEQIEHLLSDYAMDSQIVCVSSNYKDLLLYVKKHPENYLFFLDLDFGSNEFNGIDIANKIREISPASKIVFVTNHYELALDVLKSGIEPFGFIEKTTDITKMNRSCYQYIYLACKTLSSKEEKIPQKMITLKPGFEKEIEIPVEDILYVEAVKTKSHCICYHTLNGSSITVRESIEHALGQLGDEFVQSHRSVIVHKNHMIGLNDGMIQFINGECAPCSFRMRNKIKGVIYGDKK